MGIAPGPTRTASPISVGVASIRSGALRPPPMAAPEPDATWHAAELSWYSRKPRARSPRAGSTSGITGPSPNEATWSTRATISASVNRVRARSASMCGCGSGMRPVRSTKSAAAAPSLVSAGPAVLDPLAIGTVARRALGEVEVAPVDGLLLRRRRAADGAERQQADHRRGDGAGPTSSNFTG